MTVDDLRPVLPTFRYTAVDPSGVVENEVCPVYVARITGTLSPHPDEVMDEQWVTPHELGRLVADAPLALSPWLVEQVRALTEPRDADLAATFTGTTTEAGA